MQPRVVVKRMVRDLMAGIGDRTQGVMVLFDDSVLSHDKERNPQFALLEEVEAGTSTGNQSTVPDFFEVHAENFSMDGGIARELLRDLALKSPVSIHGTSLGLASHEAIPRAHIQRFAALVEEIKPVLVSDHACLAWFRDPASKELHHAGDLLPFAFDRATLDATVRNVSEVQSAIGRPLLVENLSAYLSLGDDERPSAKLFDDSERETAFLNTLCERTGCGLLLDINNLMVNAHNAGLEDAAGYTRRWCRLIEPGYVQELHLAGCTPAPEGSIMVDDHSQPVSEDCWKVLPELSQRFEAPVMIERDNNLPPFSELLDEVSRARRLLHGPSP